MWVCWKMLRLESFKYKKKCGDKSVGQYGWHVGIRIQNIFIGLLMVERS